MTMYIDESKSLITNQSHNQSQINYQSKSQNIHDKPKTRKIINTTELEKNKTPLLSMWAQNIPKEQKGLVTSHERSTKKKKIERNYGGNKGRKERNWSWKKGEIGEWSSVPPLLWTILHLNHINCFIWAHKNHINLRICHTLMWLIFWYFN